MGLCCKLAGFKYDLEKRYPLLRKLELRLCVVESELNRDNLCKKKKCCFK